MAGRQARGQLLQRLLLLARGEPAPLLNQLRHLGRVDVARAAGTLCGGALRRGIGRLHTVGRSVPGLIAAARALAAIRRGAVARRTVLLLLLVLELLDHL